MMYKTLNRLVPEYLSEMFEMQSNTQNNTSVTLRSATNEAVHVPTTENEIFKWEVLSYSCVIIWNSIPLHIRKANSIDVFTANCSAWMKSQ